MEILLESSLNEDLKKSGVDSHLRRDPETARKRGPCALGVYVLVIDSMNLECTRASDERERKVVSTNQTCLKNIIHRMSTAEGTCFGEDCGRSYNQTDEQVSPFESRIFGKRKT